VVDNLKERARKANGEIQIDSQLGTGTRVRLNIKPATQIPRVV